MGQQEHDNTFKAAVFVVVRDDRGWVLLHRRKGTGYMDSYYDFPSGHIDPGEGFAGAAIRELQEETSLRAGEADLRLKHLNLNHTDFPYINAVFDVEKWQGEPKIMEPNKCDDMGFFATDALPEKCTLAVRYIEQVGFDEQGSTSYFDRDAFEQLMGVKFSDVIE